MSTLKVELKPFTTPNCVIAVMPPRPRQEGFHEPPTWRLDEIEAQVLSEMCHAFRQEIFKKAGKKDPEAP